MSTYTVDPDLIPGATEELAVKLSHQESGFCSCAKVGGTAAACDRHRARAERMVLAAGGGPAAPVQDQIHAIALTNSEIDEVGAVMLAAGKAAADAPYGVVEYADPGYQSDGKKRYPLDTAEHARAAWGYINQDDNADAYSASDLAKVKSKIVAACRKYGIKTSDSNSVQTSVQDDHTSRYTPEDYRRREAAAMVSLSDTGMDERTAAQIQASVMARHSHLFGGETVAAAVMAAAAPETLGPRTDGRLYDEEPMLSQTDADAEIVRLTGGTVDLTGRTRRSVVVIQPGTGDQPGRGAGVYQSRFHAATDINPADTSGGAGMESPDEIIARATKGDSVLSGAFGLTAQHKRSGKFVPKGHSSNPLEDSDDDDADDPSTDVDSEVARYSKMRDSLAS